MNQYYYVKETSGYTVRVTTGQNSEVIAFVNTKRAALAMIARLNRPALH